MDRKRIARIAYTAAADRLLAARDAGAIDNLSARAKLAALRRAYDKRVSDIELRSFLAARGLERIAGRAA